MKIEDLVMLSKAGFTKDEIMSFLSPDPEPAAQPDPQTAAQPIPAPQPDPQPVPAPQPDPKPVPSPQPEDDRLSKLETKIDYVINRFNYMAVQNSQQPSQHEESIEDILSSVVRGVKEK